MFAAFLSTLLFSISGVSGHRSAQLLGATEANFWRLAAATLMLGVWAGLFGLGLAGEAFPVFVLSGLAGIGVGDLAMFQAFPRLGSRLSLLLIECLGPPFAALVEWLWLGTALSVRQMACGLSILGGVGLALRPGAGGRRTRREVVVGTLFCTVSALATALGAVLSRKAFAIAHDEGRAMNGATAAFQRILGGLFVAGVFLLLVKHRELRERLPILRGLSLPEAAKKWRGVWPWVLVNSLAGQTLGVSCMQWALRTTPTGIVLSIIALTPILIIPLAVVFEGERPTRLSLLGGAIAVAGVVALTLSN